MGSPWSVALLRHADRSAAPVCGALLCLACFVRWTRLARLPKKAVAKAGKVCYTTAI